MQDNLYRAEDNTALRFFEREIKNNYQSEKTNSMVFDTGLFVEVITPGSANSMPEFLCETRFSDGVTPVKRTTYYERFAKQIEAYREQNGTYNIQGTPLQQWTQIDVGTAATLRASGITTVEQLAQVSDGNLYNLGIGGRTLREKAAQWLTSREFGIPAAAAGTKISHLEEKVLSLEAENATLRAQLAQASAPAPQISPADAAQALGGLLGSETSGAPFDAALRGLAGDIAGLSGASDPPAAQAPALVI